MLPLTPPLVAFGAARRVNLSPRIGGKGRVRGHE